jgi:hypothetical protein
LSVLVARGLSDPASAFGRPVAEVQDDVVSVVRRAIEIGLTPDVETFAKEFLTAVHKR